MTDPVLSCRPVDWSPLAALAPDAPETPIYNDSIVSNCELCGTEIWLGPLIRQAKEMYPEAPLTCFLCVIKNAQPDTTVTHLGNNDYPGSAK